MMSLSIGLSSRTSWPPFWYSKIRTPARLICVGLELLAAEAVLVGEDQGPERCARLQRIEEAHEAGATVELCARDRVVDIDMLDATLSEAFTVGIQPAIEVDCGLIAIRVDRVEHNEKICDRIIAEIRKAQFMVADFTGHRAGVYYEAGFAAALGRPVIWTCRKDELDKTHFETRQYNHIDWQTPAELRQRLADRIRATIVNASHDLASTGLPADSLEGILPIGSGRVKNDKVCGPTH